MVAVEVALRDGFAANRELSEDILRSCRALLPEYKAPTFLRFVAELPIADQGKLARPE